MVLYRPLSSTYNILSVAPSGPFKKGAIVVKIIVSIISILATLAICGFTLSNLDELPGAQPELGQKVTFRQGALLCAQPETNCSRVVAGPATISKSPNGYWQLGEYIFISREEIGNITIPGDEKLIQFTQHGWVKISQIKFK